MCRGPVARARSTDMGAGASSSTDAAILSPEDVGKWSKEQVGDQVAAIGKAFEPYKEIAINEAIDGRTLLDVDDEDLEAYGVTKKPHRKRILKIIEETKRAPASNANASPQSGDLSSQVRTWGLL